MSRRVRVAFMDVSEETMPEGISVLSVQQTKSILDFDVVVWKMTSCLSYPVSKGMIVEHPLVDVEDSLRLRNSQERCDKEIAEFLDSGRTLVVMLPKPARRTLTIHRKGNNDYPVVNVMDFLPKSARGSTVDSSGTAFEFRGPPPLESFWRNMRDIAEFHSYFENPVGKPYLFVKGTSKVIGSVVNCAKGTIVYIPHLRRAESTEERRNFLARLARAVGELPALLGKERVTVRTPDWLSSYRLPSEDDKEKAVAESHQLLQVARAETDARQRALDVTQQRKLLLYGTGLPLQEQVIAAFNAMGVKAENGPDGMDDAVLRYSDAPGVAEVFGSTGSASLKKARQVTHWVERFHKEHDEDPKGFYIVNAYRETAPKERTEPTFPDNVVTYCAKRGYCLVTTTQLLCILLILERDPQETYKILSGLFDTVGVYGGHSAVEDYLPTQSNATTEDPTS